MVKDSRIYCGDLKNLPQTYNRFGSRWECMQCGFGAAMMKYKWKPASKDPKYPARNKKGCLRDKNHRKGIVKGNQFGKVSGSDMSPEESHKEYVVCYIIIWIVYCISLFYILYVKKPDCVTDNSKDKNIIWSKFMLFYIPSVLFFTALMGIIRYLLHLK